MASSGIGDGETPRRQFRSWGEAQIGRMLNRHEIPYFYEHPLAVVDDGKTRIWYPDFQLRGLGVLIEYFGMPDDPTYCSGMARKEAVYAANGISAISVTPDQFHGEWPTKILGRIESVLHERLLTTRAAIEGL